MTIIIIIIVIVYENYYSHIIISSVSQSRRLQKVKKKNRGGGVWTLCAPHRRRPRQPAGLQPKVASARNSSHHTFGSHCKERDSVSVHKQSTLIYRPIETRIGSK